MIVPHRCRPSRRSCRAGRRSTTGQHSKARLLRDRHRQGERPLSTPNHTRRGRLLDQSETPIPAVERRIDITRDAIVLVDLVES